MLRNDTIHHGLGTPTSNTVKKMPHRNANRPIWWRQFFSWDSFFPGMCGFVSHWQKLWQAVRTNEPMWRMRRHLLQRSPQQCSNSVSVNSLALTEVSSVQIYKSMKVFPGSNSVQASASYPELLLWTNDSGSEVLQLPMEIHWEASEVIETVLSLNSAPFSSCCDQQTEIKAPFSKKASQERTRGEGLLMAQALPRKDVWIVICWIVIVSEALACSEGLLPIIWYGNYYPVESCCLLSEPCSV